MIAPSRWLSAARNDVDWRATSRGLVVFLPLFALVLITGEIHWLNAAVITVSGFVVMEKVGLAPLGLVLHFLLIMVCFLALFFALLDPLAFVAGCALMAALTIWVTSRGETLRILGNFTFIPGLYLASELAEHLAHTPAAFTSEAISVLPYLMAAIVPVLVLGVIDALGTTPPPGRSRWQHLAHLRREFSLGERKPTLEAMIAVALGVGLAATLVEFGHLDHGQWVVWSAASVVTGNIMTVPRKFRDRATGAVIGVPLGILAGLALPHDHIVFGFAVVIGVLTLAAIKTYVLAFGIRCAMAAVAILAINESTVIASERLLNVVAGSGIGLVMVLAVHWVMREREAGG